MVTLDKRALKTPSGQTLYLPLNKTLPAALVAAEWDHQEILLKPHALPMVRRSPLPIKEESLTSQYVDIHSL